MKVCVATIAFSQNKELVRQLKFAFPEAIVNEKGIRLSSNELIDFFYDAEGVIVGLEKIDKELLNQLPNLKIVSKYGVGLDNIDIETCHEKGIQVCWTEGVNKLSVAEMTIGFILMLNRNLYTTSNQLKYNGLWNKNGGEQLSEKTVGIIGLGNVGKEVVRLLKPFNCKILGNDIVDVSEFADKNNISLTNKDIIFKQSDIVTIHTPLTEKTKDLVNFKVLSSMKNSAIVINTARGGIITLSDLKKALLSNVIAGAAIDVYDQEPPDDSELLSIPNLICTPHTGGNTKEAVLSMGISAISHLLNYYRSKHLL